MNQITQSKAARSFYPINPVQSCKSCQTLVPMRRPPDMNMRSGCGAWYRLTKREKRNPIRAQEAKQRLTFRAVRMERNVHRVAMIETPAIVNGALTKHRNRQLLLECAHEELLHFPRV